MSDPRIAEVREVLRRPAGVEELRGALALLDAVPPSPDVVREVADARRQVFQRLRHQTAEQPDTAVGLLTRDLLPRCLTPDDEADDSYGHRPSHTFGEWLDDLPEEHRGRVRREALPAALAALGGAGVRNALRLISAVGYWDDEVLRALDALARRRSDEVGDHALSARVALRPGFAAGARGEYLGLLHRRIPAGPNLHQFLCGRTIGGPETAGLVWTHWLSPASPAGDHERRMLNTFAHTLLAEVAGRERNPAVTEQVWRWLVELSHRADGDIDGVFSPNSSLVNRLDTPAVVPELVGRAVRAGGHHRYLYYLRVLECERPAHMPGWDAVPPGDLGRVRDDATTPTGMTGRFTTTEWRQKEAAWDVLLSRGESTGLPPFGAALAGERGYVTHALLELAGCLRLDPLPPAVGLILAGAADEPWDENERLVAQIGAIQAAHGSGTSEAFAALLGYRQLGDGVLLCLVAALAETARRSLEGGDRSCVDRLLQLAEEASREDSRGAAAAAVAALVEDGALGPPDLSRAAALLNRPGTDVYTRRELMFALATLPPADVPSPAVEYATEALPVAAPLDQDHDPYPAAVVLVARQVDRRADAAFLDRHLGLVERGGTLAPTPRTLEGVAPHVVGRYFVADPQRFGPAVAAVLRGGDAGALGHVLPAVREGAGRIPVEVVDALVARLRQADRGWTAEPPILQAVAAVAPDRLVADGCSGMSSWLPQLRAELADTLGRLGPLTPELSAARFEVLARLAGDGTYAVRRAAYRAAAASDPERLAALAAGWAQWSEPGREGPRRYAAECAGWLADETGASRLADLGSDPEPGVRKAYEQSLREREGRRAAAGFEAAVLGVSSPADVIRNWRHGIGLGLVGDDETTRRLADRLREGPPPAVRFWLARVIKAVERRWAEVTRKWPDPWVARPGHLESFSGVIRGADGREAPVSGTLWQVPAESPGGRYSWGGWAVTERWRVDDAELVIPGRRAVRVLVGQSLIPTGRIVFSGAGPYPSPAPETA